jgi:hypothetical protein
MKQAKFREAAIISPRPPMKPCRAHPPQPQQTGGRGIPSRRGNHP